MGYKNADEEQQLPLTADSELDSLDGPPLYSETTRFIPSDVALVSPEARATPDEVRDFIVAVLTQSRGLGVDHARRVAARWTVGTGRELSKYPVAMFRDIFGSEDGWTVYKEVRLVQYRQENEKWKKKQRPRYIVGFVLLCLWIVGAVTFIYYNPDSLWMVAAILGIMAALPSLLVTLLGMFGREDAEERAENELKNGYNKSPGPQAT